MLLLGSRLLRWYPLRLNSLRFLWAPFSRGFIRWLKECASLGLVISLKWPVEGGSLTQQRAPWSNFLDSSTRRVECLGFDLAEFRKDLAFFQSIFQLCTGVSIASSCFIIEIRVLVIARHMRYCCCTAFYMKLRSLYTDVEKKERDRKHGRKIKVERRR